MGAVMKQPIRNCAAAVASSGTPRYPDCTGAVDVLARHDGPGRGRGGPCGPNRRGDAGGTVRPNDPHHPAAGRKRGFAGGAGRPSDAGQGPCAGKRAVLIFEFDVPPHAAEGGARQRLRRRLRAGQIPLRRRTQRGHHGGLSAQIDPGPCRAGGAGLRPDHHGGEGHHRRRRRG